MKTMRPRPYDQQSRVLVYLFTRESYQKYEHAKREKCLQMYISHFLESANLLSCYSAFRCYFTLFIELYLETAGFLALF